MQPSENLYLRMYLTISCAVPFVCFGKYSEVRGSLSVDSPPEMFSDAKKKNIVIVTKHFFLGSRFFFIL